MLSLNFHIFVEEVMWLIVFYYSVFMVTLLAIAVSVQLLANYQVSDGHLACQNLDIRNSQ